MSHYPPNTVIRRGNSLVRAYVADPHCQREGCGARFTVAVAVVLRGREVLFCWRCGNGAGMSSGRSHSEE